MRLVEFLNEKDLIGKPTPSFDDVLRKFSVSRQNLQKELQLGMKEEHEHVYTNDEAREIALDHLWEDPEYYTKLLKMMK